MGVMLSAGGSLRWYRDTMCWPESHVAQTMGIDPYEIITKEAAAAPVGSEGLLFLPYLTGERTPHPDPQARGAFVGLTVRHHKAHLARAVLEGVAFGLKDSLEILKSMNVSIGNIRTSGGGARSEVWRQIQADIFGYPLSVMAADEGPALGVALLAGVGAGLYKTVEEACSTVVKISGTTSTQPGSVAKYEKYYDVYRALYPALKGSFSDIGALVN
jgi:xylulokinase